MLLKAVIDRLPLYAQKTAYSKSVWEALNRFSKPSPSFNFLSIVHTADFLFPGPAMQFREVPLRLFSVSTCPAIIATNATFPFIYPRNAWLVKAEFSHQHNCIFRKMMPGLSKPLPYCASQTCFLGLECPFSVRRTTSTTNEKKWPHYLSGPAAIC